MEEKRNEIIFQEAGIMELSQWLSKHLVIKENQQQIN